MKTISWTVLLFTVLLFIGCPHFVHPIPSKELINACYNRGASALIGLVERDGKVNWKCCDSPKDPEARQLCLPLEMFERRIY